MKLKGIDKLREKLPSYTGRKIYVIPAGAVGCAILAYFLLLIFDILPRIFSDIIILGVIEPMLPLIGTSIVAAIANWLVGTVWSKREDMKSKFGDLAYQRIIPRGFLGISLIIPLIFHTFTPISLLPPLSPINDLTTEMSRSLLLILGANTVLDIVIRLALSGSILLLGLLVIRSSFLTFGIDYMTVVYLYFPEESELQEHEIYSVLRHPTYMGAVLLGAAGMFFSFSFYSILMFLIIYILFKIQIRREEIELIERFGKGYSEYKKQVPALYVRPRDIQKFFKFITTRMD